MQEDERKESEIRSHRCPRPNLRSSGVTQQQLAKFRELQRRRLQMQTKSKNRRKHKDGKGKFVSEDLNAKELPDENTNQRLSDSGEDDSCSKSIEEIEAPSPSPHSQVHPALKKKKLHWGLDTKERWERKANM